MTDLAPASPHEPPAPVRHYKMHAPNIPETAKVARDMVAGLLSATGHSALVDTARLLVSEVVANVHLHTTVPLLLVEATVRNDRVRVSVQDDDPRPIPRSPRDAVSADAEGGRGLLLVQACAAAWGTVWHGGLERTGKSVWFELCGTSDR